MLAPLPAPGLDLVVLKPPSLIPMRTRNSNIPFPRTLPCLISPPIQRLFPQERFSTHKHICTPQLLGGSEYLGEGGWSTPSNPNYSHFFLIFSFPSPKVIASACITAPGVYDVSRLQLMVLASKLVNILKLFSLHVVF